MKVRNALLVPGVLLALSGCSGDPSPAPTVLPPVTEAPTPTARSASPIPLPPEAMQDSRQGANAFARYYLQVLNEAFQSNDEAALESISADECETCANFIGLVQEGRRKGDSFSGGAFSVLSAESTSRPDGDYLVDVLYDRAASTSRTADGSVENSPPETRTFMQMLVTSSNGRLMAREIAYPEVPR